MRWPRHIIHAQAACIQKDTQNPTNTTVFFLILPQIHGKGATVSITHLLRWIQRWALPPMYSGVPGHGAEQAGGSSHWVWNSRDTLRTLHSCCQLSPGQRILELGRPTHYDKKNSSSPTREPTRTIHMKPYTLHLIILHTWNSRPPSSPRTLDESRLPSTTMVATGFYISQHEAACGAERHILMLVAHADNSRNVCACWRAKFFLRRSTHALASRERQGHSAARPGQAAPPLSSPSLPPQ